MNIYSDEIKRSVSMEDVCRMYGIDISRGGFIKCIWHADSKPSLKVYDGTRGCHCFACQKGGSVIDFAMQYFTLNFAAACRKLNEDFNLGLPLGRHLSREEQRVADREARKRREEQSKIKREGELLARRYHAALDRYIALDRILTANKPQSPEGITQEYANALKQLPIAKHNLEQAEVGIYKYEHRNDTCT